MKQFTLTLAILCAFSALTFAGTQPSGKDKEVMQPAPPPCDWYRANEWNLGIWGTYAFPANTGTPDLLPNFLGSTFNTSATSISEDFDHGSAYNDRFINRSGAWGGGAELKYFFDKYMAVGAEGFVLDCNDNVGGAVLGTFTFRWPIGCSRFAPYGWAGVGAVDGGSHEDQFIHIRHDPPPEEIVAFTSKESIENKHADALGQFGLGCEIRLTHPSERCKIGVGVMTDFAWNVVSGPNNNFGMWRFGLNFNY